LRLTIKILRLIVGYLLFPSGEGGEE